MEMHDAVAEQGGGRNPVGAGERPDRKGNRHQQAKRRRQSQRCKFDLRCQRQRQKILQEGVGENGGCSPCCQADGNAEKSHSRISVR